MTTLPLLASGFFLERHLRFLAELDKLKEVRRRSLVGGSLRHENSAEHSWHLAMMALVLTDNLKVQNLDQFRVVKMLLVHDIVEIDAGDTFCYDTAGVTTKVERELAAAERLFPLLPEALSIELRGLWDEFEAGATLEAKFAQGLDRLQPILQNLRTCGASWRAHGVTRDQVIQRNQRIGETMPEIWHALKEQLDLAEAAGWFMPAPVC